MYLRAKETLEKKKKGNENNDLFKHILKSFDFKDSRLLGYIHSEISGKLLNLESLQTKYYQTETEFF